MATTTNFGWETPDDTDLVKDGAAAMRTLGNAIDTSFVDLKGGTTNQVLAKNSNTDLDFKWVADATGIPATIIDAKGDLIAGTAADTADRLAVGTNGQILTADSTTSTGLKWATPAAAGGATLLETITFAGASSYTSASIAGTYKDLYIIVRDFLPSTDGTQLQLRPNANSSTIYNHNTSFTSTQAFGQTMAELTGNSDNVKADGLIIITIADYANAVTSKIIEAKSFTYDATTSTSSNWRYSFTLFNSQTAISTVQFLAASGNLTSGSALIYGVN